MIRFGKYRALRPLAQGRMSVVYLCEDPDLRASVAVKAFRPAGGAETATAKLAERWRQRFIAEARWLARIDHPNVVHVRVLDFADDGAPYYVMPYLPATLPDEIGHDGLLPGGQRPAPRALPLRRALAVLDDLLAGLVGLHAAGLVHRAVRPTNLLLSADAGGRIKLCDLGLARLPGESPEDDPGGFGVAIENDGYAAPELVRAPAEAEAAADVYATAAVGFRLLSGMPPPAAAKACLDELAALPLPIALAAPLSAALAQSPKDRPDAAALRDGLAAARVDIETVQRSSDDGRLSLSVRAAPSGPA